MDETYCPMCSCSNAPLGALGNLVHYQCRDCGILYSVMPEKEIHVDPRPKTNAASSSREHGER